MARDPVSSQAEALGSLIHAQRKLAKLSLRELAALSDLSDAYISQIERGLHQPSIRSLTSVSRALGLSPEALLRQAGMLDEDGEPTPDQPVESTEPGSARAAILADPSLTDAQREALLAVYRSFSGE